MDKGKVKSVDLTTNPSLPEHFSDIVCFNDDERWAENTSFRLLRIGISSVRCVDLLPEKAYYEFDNGDFNPLLTRLEFKWPDSRLNGVSLIGDFSKWQPIAMARLNNYFAVHVILPLAGTFRYAFICDGHWTYDPQIEHVTLPAGDICNVITTDGGEIVDMTGAQFDGAYIPTLTKANFIWPHPGARTVSLVGDFSKWVPVPMVKRRNQFHLIVTNLPKGSQYHYAYIVDGVWMTNASQEISRTADGKICNVYVS